MRRSQYQSLHLPNYISLYNSRSWVSALQSMTMSPEAAVTKMNSLEGFNADEHNCGAQNPQLSERMKPTETEEQKRLSSSDASNSRQMGVQVDNNGVEESRTDKEMVNPASFESLLPRIDRLDKLLDYLQEKRTAPPLTMNGNGHDSTLEENGFEERCKPIGWVLHEIQAKGTILDRIATLEERVTKLAEELERRQCIDMMEGVRLRLNGSSGCDIFVEEKTVPSLPCESVEKGLHEQFSRRVLQALDTPPKDERKEDERKTERKGGKGKGKLRRMLPDCMKRPST